MKYSEEQIVRVALEFYQWWKTRDVLWHSYSAKGRAIRDILYDLEFLDKENYSRYLNLRWSQKRALDKALWKRWCKKIFATPFYYVENGSMGFEAHKCIKTAAHIARARMYLAENYPHIKFKF